MTRKKLLQQKRMRQHQKRQRQLRQKRYWIWLRVAIGPSLALVLGVGLAIGLTIGLNSKTGRDLIASAITTATVGRVQVQGLGGRLPFAPQIESLELADAEGPWLRIEHAKLEINPAAFLAGKIEIPVLKAGAVDLLRRPQGNNGPSRDWPPPIALSLQRLEIDRLRLNGLIEAAPTLSIQGSARLSREGLLTTKLAVRSLEFVDTDTDTDVDGQSLHLDLSGLVQPDTFALSLDSRWSGIRLSGQLRWPANAPFPFGAIRLKVARLEALNRLVAPWLPDLEPPALAGHLTAKLTSDPSGLLSVDLNGNGLQLPRQLGLERLTLQAEIADLLNQPRIQSRMQLSGLRLPKVEANLNAQVSGPITRLMLTTESKLQLKQTAHAGEIQLSAAGELEPFDRRLGLSALSLEYERALRSETGEGLGLRLLEPGRIDFSAGLSVDRLAFEFLAPTATGTSTGTATRGASGRIGISGQLAPVLALDARAIDVPLATLISLLPSTAQLPAPFRTINGLIDVETGLEGEQRAPIGRLDLLAREIRSDEGTARGLPAGELRLALRIGPQATSIDAAASVGNRANLDLRGQIEGSPFTTLGTLSLRSSGRIDTGLLNPQLAASGRTLDGQLALNLGIGGQLNQPRLDGIVRFSDGAWKDQLIGLVLTQIDGEIALSGDSLKLTRLSAQADPGTILMSGSLGWLAPRQPVDLRVSARAASPLRLDQLQLQADADLRLSGELTGNLDLIGSLRFDQIALRIPERFPATVATLEVKEIGPRRQPRRDQQRRGGLNLGSPARITLDLRIDAPRAITLTGRGIDAELGGEINARGTLANPAVIGDFRLLRGEYELLGQPLRFTRGRIGFNGASVLDPTLDLEARVNAEGATAILSVEGTAGRPEIRLSGEPEMPEDEVLARLLFGLSRSRLSTLQVARLGLAATSIAGIDNPAIELLERTRSGLGLDRFRLDGGAERQGRGDAILEGGRYLSERVYLGARQGTRAGDTQGILRMEVSPRVRLETDVGANGGARAGAAFELEY